MNLIELKKHTDFNIIDDKCKDCPFNDTECPGGMWCSEEY
jgi:hypothetical protein